MNQENIKHVYHVTISLLSPLHIGSGKELLRDYDYVTHGGRTWVMNPDGFLAHLQRPDGSFDERILGRPAAELLMPADFRDGSEFFRYVLPGQPRAQGHGAVLREQYKDAFDRPYLPGSSLKGALRTVLAWHGFQEQKLQLDLNEIRGGRSWAGQSIERKIFGQNPNYDLLRALHVADSAPAASDRLQIVNAQVVTGSEQMGSPVELEAIRADTVFRTTITVDTHLLSQSIAQQLRFGERGRWLESLPAIAQRYARQRIVEEGRWYQSRNYARVAGFYSQLANALRKGLGRGRFLLQVGWGGGWNGKTIGAPLQQDTQTWERLLGDKRLSPARIRRRTSDPFPKSRRAVVAAGQVAAPLGWCLVEMKESK